MDGLGLKSTGVWSARPRSWTRTLRGPWPGGRQPDARSRAGRAHAARDLHPCFSTTLLGAWPPGTSPSRRQSITRSCRTPLHSRAMTVRSAVITPRRGHHAVTEPARVSLDSHTLDDHPPDRRPCRAETWHAACHLQQKLIRGHNHTCCSPGHRTTCLWSRTTTTSQETTVEKTGFR